MKSKYCRLHVLDNANLNLPLEREEEYINTLNRQILRSSNNIGLMVTAAFAIGTKECATFFHKDNADFVAQLLQSICNIRVEKEFVTNDEVERLACK